MIKTYKPGQIITIDNKRYRIVVDTNGWGVRCRKCDLLVGATIGDCFRYCCKCHNNWDKYPNGYIFKRI